MTNPQIVEDFLAALQSRALNQAGDSSPSSENPALQYTLGYLHSLLLELNFQGYDAELLKRNTEFLKELNLP